VALDSNLHIRPAEAPDADDIEAMLLEAARWVDALGVVMWEEGELDRARLEREIAAQQFVVAEAGCEVAGAIRFQLDDALFWPDLPAGRSAFVHRLVVRRAFKGRGVSQALLQWAVDRARSLGREALRLDCDADRSKLRRLYEDFGFVLHSYRQVGPYYVSRYELPLAARLDDQRPTTND
jgi:GNAT superfamily N-acetyltransferase